MLPYQKYDQNLGNGQNSAAMCQAQSVLWLWKHSRQRIAICFLTV